MGRFFVGKIAVLLLACYCEGLAEHEKFLLL